MVYDTLRVLTTGTPEALEEFALESELKGAAAVAIGAAALNKIAAETPAVRRLAQITTAGLAVTALYHAGVARMGRNFAQNPQGQIDFAASVQHYFK